MLSRTIWRNIQFQLGNYLYLKIKLKIIYIVIIYTRIHTQGLKRSNDHPDTRAILFEDEKYNKRKVVDFLAAINGFKSILDTLKVFRGKFMTFYY